MFSKHGILKSLAKAVKNVCDMTSIIEIFKFFSFLGNNKFEDYIPCRSCNSKLI